MKGEIKFRAWDMISKEWHYYNMLQEMDASNYYDNFKNYKYHSKYTGQKDKNDKEICTGDFVKFIDNNGEYIIKEVYFDIELLEFGFKNSSALFHSQFSKEFEIVGNIYETKD